MSDEKVFIRTFREVMREVLVEKQSVHIEGLGRFENVHEQQQRRRNGDGNVVMVPPIDKVVFTPEKKEGE